MELIKRKILQITGFDLFELEYLLFLIPGSVVVPFFRLFFLFTRGKWEKKLVVEFLVITFIYSLIFVAGVGVLVDHIPRTMVAFINFIMFCLANFLFSVAWMGFYDQLK